jgi:DNA-binding transcriptional regulator YiaG
MVKLKEQMKLTPHYWTPKYITAARKRRKFSKERFAHYLGINVRTVNHWEANKSQPSRLACKMLTDFEAKITQLDG